MWKPTYRCLKKRQPLKGGIRTTVHGHWLPCWWVKLSVHTSPPPPISMWRSSKRSYAAWGYPLFVPHSTSSSGSISPVCQPVPRPPNSREGAPSASQLAECMVIDPLLRAPGRGPTWCWRRLGRLLTVCISQEGEELSSSTTSTFWRSKLELETSLQPCLFWSCGCWRQPPSLSCPEGGAAAPDRSVLLCVLVSPRADQRPAEWHADASRGRRQATALPCPWGSSASYWRESTTNAEVRGDRTITQPVVQPNRGPSASAMTSVASMRSPSLTDTPCLGWTSCWTCWEGPCISQHWTSPKATGRYPSPRMLNLILFFHP